ncbi:hypothetical protein KFE25_007790 [Diacronema lutheri]|uniref:Uncharacterized protein n=2 Tax=Diacronema lutheri TaxID=2081491 RepID=A0A8J5XVB5_DIALT|nr:hypothetical protein KFE25_007790 [Diacronema lutheri]
MEDIWRDTPDPLRAAEAVLAQTSYLAGVPASSYSAGDELDALAREMRAFDTRAGAPAHPSDFAHDHQPSGGEASHGGYARDSSYALPRASAAELAQRTPALTPASAAATSLRAAQYANGARTPFATPAGAYGGSGAGGGAPGALLSAAPTGHIRASADIDSREAAAALRALQERVRALEAERAQLQREFEAQRASTLELEHEVRRVRLEQEERVSSLVGSLDAARADAARSADAQRAQIGALRRELEYVTQLAQAAEADRRVAHAQLEALEAELGAQRADSGEHAGELDQRTAELDAAAEATRARARDVGGRLAAERAERSSLGQQRARVEDSLRRVIGMNGQLIERVARPPTSSAQAARAGTSGRPHAQLESERPAAGMPRDAPPPVSCSAHGDDNASVPSDTWVEPATPALPARSLVHAELARVLAHAEGELESARAQYIELVRGAYDTAARGHEMPQAPILAALQRVEAKAAQLDSTRRALTAANDEIATAHSALAQSNRALAKSAEVSEKRLKALNKLKPPEPLSTVRRLTSSHTAASAARSAQRPSSGGRG